MALITVEFHGIWRLFLGTAKCNLDADDIDEALEKIMEKYWPGVEKKLRERGTKLDGDFLKYSYVVLNKTNIKQLQDRKLKAGDVLHLHLAVPGG